VIDRVRGKHPVWVFTYKGSPVKNICNTAWKEARKEVGLPFMRIHDLKHTFGGASARLGYRWRIGQTYSAISRGGSLRMLPRWS
jgi:integrase